MKNIDILKKFVEEYYRSPTEREFIKCGGKNYRSYGSYRKFLNYYGFDAPTKTKTVQVLNDRGTVVFEGTVKDVAEEYNTSVQNVRRDIKNNWLFKRYYKVVYKEVNDDLFNA